ncbi:SNF2-related protein, partial [Pseudomonas aeruginosa]
MKLIHNTGSQRVIDLIRPHLKRGNQLGCVTPSFSLYAFAEVREALSTLERVQLIVPPDDAVLELLGSEGDRAARNRLQARWLANQCAKWISEKVDLRRASRSVPQGAAVMRRLDGTPEQVVLGSFAFSKSGLGLTPGNPLSLIQASESADEAAQLAQWFDHQWANLQSVSATDSEDKSKGRDAVLEALRALGEHRDPFTIYTLMLHHLFRDSGDEMDEERIVKSATGIRNTVVWKKLFKFQRDGVVGAIDKLNRFGGCIIADSVGLGKTFEALAIIKYHELRNDRVLVLAPKRLRDNWTLYKANDKRNVLAGDRFNYDVLNHTDLSRDGGTSGDIDLSHVNWGNYDLVVIDESHNFRNKATHKGKESRYDRLMRRIIREGVKTRVLMLSATPVNNRLADLRNQIAFATEGDDTAL